ncbi:hypothetical protein ACL9RF_04110 [Sphingobacterium sp. Mn56C]|uniref:hypothetical protein n=1 Tax=Sphingobacterium sp. Mn56C TaxID=3395261 RepID=UPI003BBC8725
MINTINFKKNIYSSITIAALLFFHSCSTTTDKLIEIVPGGKAKLEVEISKDFFAEKKSIQLIGSTAASRVPERTAIQTASIDLNDKYTLSAAWVAEPSAAYNAVNSKAASNMLTTTITTLQPYIKYKLLVFDDKGKFISERDYTHGKEQQEDQLLLQGGINYTFVAFSVNSATVLPAVHFADETNKTLATASIANLSGSLDFMYAKVQKVLESDITYKLSLEFKHKFSQITTTIDAKSTGYNITEVQARFSPHFNAASVNLSTGDITQKGTESLADVKFSALHKPTVTSSPTLINAAATQTASLTINSITIGPMQKTDALSFKDLALKPGVKYNLIIKVNPKDEYLTHVGIPAARINGSIWALHNVGVSTSQDPNQEPITAALHGNYYQFGRIIPTAGPTDTNINSEWTWRYPALDAWNAGSIEAPKKTENDPCPKGFRIPTQIEWRDLLESTTASNVGNFKIHDTHFNAAKVLTSKRKKNVRLVLPAQGWMNTNSYNISVGLRQRGININYYSSTVDAGGMWRLAGDDLDIDISYLQKGRLTQSRPLRCIAE